jgi:hypothetical protein
VSHAIAVILLAAALCAAAIVAWVVISERLDRPPAGRHRPFADPADRTDPDGTQWTAQLRDDSDRHWAPHVARPPVVEVLTGPGTSIPGLARGTGQFRMLPPDPAPPPLPETGEIPVICADYGIPPDSDQYLDDTFAEATATVKGMP